MTIHHAPWSKYFKTMWFKGRTSYELQIGPLVFQWYYEQFGDSTRRGKTFLKRGLIWRDLYWRR